MPSHWIVRANKDGVEAVDANDSPVSLCAGQRGYVECSQALALARSGAVTMLSPDGVDELESNPVAPQEVSTVSVLPTYSTPTTPPVAEPSVQAPPSAAPRPPRVGVKLSMPKQ